MLNTLPCSQVTASIQFAFLCLIDHFCQESKMKVMIMCYEREIQTWPNKKNILIMYILPKVKFFFCRKSSIRGHLLVGKFTFTGGEFKRAGGDFPQQFIS